jgi:hypothetical protein
MGMAAGEKIVMYIAATKATTAEILLAVESSFPETVLNKPIFLSKP